MEAKELKLGDLLQARRKEAGLSQDAVASACGMTQGHYSKLERGSIEPGRRARAAAERWLQSGGRAPERPGSSRPSRLETLARTIEQACAQLARAAREIDAGASPVGRRRRKPRS